MNERDIEALVSSEKEWRIYLTTKVDKIEERLSSHMAWNLVFRLGGGILFGLLIVWIEAKIK